MEEDFVSVWNRGYDWSKILIETHDRFFVLLKVGEWIERIVMKWLHVKGTWKPMILSQKPSGSSNWLIKSAWRAKARPYFSPFGLAFQKLYLALASVNWSSSLKQISESAARSNCAELTPTLLCQSCFGLLTPFCQVSWHCRFYIYIYIWYIHLFGLYFFLLPSYIYIYIYIYICTILILL